MPFYLGNDYTDKLKIHLNYLSLAELCKLYTGGYVSWVCASFLAQGIVIEHLKID